jgi:hypothetical protein
MPVKLAAGAAGSATFAPLVIQLTQALADKNDTAGATKLVVALAAKPTT